MSSARSIDFITAISPSRHERKKSVDFNICYAYPTFEKDAANSDVTIIRREHVNPQSPTGNDVELVNDFSKPQGPLTNCIVKPYCVSTLRKIVVESTPKVSKKLLEIAVREVKIHRSFNGSQSPIDITAVSIVFKDRTVCKCGSPFNRKLHKLLLKDTWESNNLSIRVHARDGNSSSLPFPLPTFYVKNKKMQIEFSILDELGRIHSGTVTCTVTTSDGESITFKKKSSVDSTNNPEEIGADESETEVGCIETTASTSDRIQPAEPNRHFSLYHPALCLATPAQDENRKKKEEIRSGPDVVVLEQPNLWMVGLSLGKWFQARRPLRPLSATNTHKLRSGREEIVSITILRAVEVPVREESALVQPLIQVHWGANSQFTSVANGPAPVWQQTMEFPVSRQKNEHSVIFSLYDQHPIWGLQWLGDATIPLEYHRNYQEFERWIGLSPLTSPVLRFGYVQASPVRSHTRIYILMKMERAGNLVKSTEINSTDAIAKSIQRCMTIPYKISGTEKPEDCAELAMLLNPLPNHYGPLTPKQALKLNKVDDFGRAALLATLLQGLDLDAYVLIGSSQASKWAAFVVSFDDKGTSPYLWDPETGENYDIGDSRCSLIKASRIINHQNIWKNVQKSTIAPFNLRFNPKSNKDWQPLQNPAATSGAPAANRQIQMLEMGEEASSENEEEDLHLEMERHFREKLSEWRADMSLTTIFNRHAVTIIRNYLGKFNGRQDSQPDKRELRQLYRAYHTHGFILNLRRDSPAELAERLFATKIHEISGPVEFALACRLQKHVAKTCSVWLAIVVLRARD